MSTWKYGNTPDSIVDTGPRHEGMTGDSFEYYGGNLICESVDPRHKALITAAPELLEFAERVAALQIGKGDPVVTLDVLIDMAKEAIKQAKP